MNRQIIRDFKGIILGYVDTDEKGNKTVRDFQERILGYYDSNLDVTRDFQGRILARGDVASSLIFNNNN